MTWSLKRGDKDDGDSKIEDVFWVTDRFVIYQADGQVRYKLPDDYQTAKTLRRRIGDLGGLRASIEELRSHSALSEKEKKRAAREIAWALADAFEDDGEKRSEKPKQVLARVDARLRSLVKSSYRRKFIFANLGAFAAIEAILVLIAVTLFPLLPEHVQAIPHYALFGAMGGLGAFLSVMIGVRSIDVNLNLKGWEHIYAGATRIFIGVIGAWVVGLALDSTLINPTFGQGQASAQNASGLPPLQPGTAMYLILAFLAGFSESLVPNLLRRGEQAVGGDKADTAGEPIVEKIQP